MDNNIPENDIDTVTNTILKYIDNNTRYQANQIEELQEQIEETNDLLNRIANKLSFIIFWSLLPSIISIGTIILIVILYYGII